MERRHVGESLQVYYGRISDEIGVAEDLVCERCIGDFEGWAGCWPGFVGGSVGGSIVGGTDWRWHYGRGRGYRGYREDLV